jgi:peptidoglycan/LPS O-acetylase OafA/YrhL
MPALDGLRGIAVLLVLVTHTPRLVDRSPDALAENGTLRFMSHGMFAVDIFFVLSGFLITTLLLAEHDRDGRIDVVQFWGRRVRRLLPAAVVLFFVHGVYAAYAGLSVHRESVAVLSGLTGTANYVMAFRPGDYGPQFVHLWSLAIEAQFYLLFPLALTVLIRFRRWPLIVGAAAMVAVVWRFVMYDAVGPFAILWRTDTHADPLLIGVLCGWCWWRYRPAVSSLAVPACAIVVVGCMWQAPSWFVSRAGFTVVAVTAAFAVLAVTGGNRWLEPFRTIGVVSYGLYLWHLPIFAAVARTELPPLVRVSVAWIVSVAASAASFVWIERRYMNARKPDRDVMFVENI